MGSLLLGLAAALMLALRRDERSIPLAGVFAAGVIRQAIQLADPSRTAFGPNPATLGEASLCAGALAGLFALWALHHTALERDRAEDLHWDSMEAVRSLNELAARAPDAAGQRLDALLELGVQRLGMRVGLLISTDETSVLALHRPRELEIEGGALRAALEKPLARTALADRAIALEDLDERCLAWNLRSFVGVAVRVDGTLRALLAFAGEKHAPLGATDKDLLALMAQWAGNELEARAPASAPPARRTRRAPLERLERRLREHLGSADYTLALDPSLGETRTGRLPLDTLTLCLVDAARRLSPHGPVHIESRPVPGALSGGWVTLSVSVDANHLQADALTRAFDAVGSKAVPSLTVVQERLRGEGGDISVAVETGRGATLTAFLPVRRPARGGQRRRAQSSRYVV